MSNFSDDLYVRAYYNKSKEYSHLFSDLPSFKIVFVSLEQYTQKRRNFFNNSDCIYCYFTNSMSFQSFCRFDNLIVEVSLLPLLEETHEHIDLQMYVFSSLKGTLFHQYVWFTVEEYFQVIKDYQFSLCLENTYLL